MDRRIDQSNLDLDVAVQAVAARVESWRSAGLEIGELTWVDNDTAWPGAHVHRSATARPRSVGLRLRRTDGGGEGEVVLYAGGWADFATVVAGGRDVTATYVEVEAADQFGPLLDRYFAPILEGPGST